MNRNKVLICCFPSDLSGVPQYVLTLTKVLLEAGFEISILTKVKGVAFSNIDSRIRVIESPYLNNKISIAEVLKFRRAIKSAISHTGAEYLHLNGSLFGLAGRLDVFPGVTRIHTYHGLPFDQGVRLFQRTIMFVVETILLSITKSILIVMSQRNMNAIERLKINNKNSVKLIHNTSQKFSSFTPFKREYDFDAIRLLCVAGFRSQKNHRLLLEAFNNLPDKFTLTLVGNGTNGKDIKALALEVLDPLKYKRVKFVGESSSMTQFYIEADIFVLSSRYEGLPIAGIEALYYDLPIVITNVSGAQELSSSGSGLIVEAMDTKSLVSSITRLYNELKSGQREIGVSRANYEALFSYEAFKASIIELYK